MGILDDALSSQDAKQSQRLSKEAQKTKIENNKVKEGTYRGIDLVDGTAKIQLDGQTNTTSGYKLITDAPLGDGDRVSIRPNGVGMPRADARNVAPDIAVEGIKIINDIAAFFGGMDFFVASGGKDITKPSSGMEILSILPWVDYLYSADTKRFKNKKQALPILTGTLRKPFGDPTVGAPNIGDPLLSSYEINFTRDQDGNDRNEIKIIMNVPLANLPSPFSVSSFLVVFPKKLFESKFTNIPVGTYGLLNSPIEVEMFVNNALIIASNTRQTNVDILEDAGNYSLSVFTSNAISAGSAIHTFSFRFRKRVTSGDPLPWFSLG